MSHSDTIATAEQDAADAAALAAALEQRILDGDETITAEELAARKDLAKFAELRVEAAKRKRERATTEQLHADVDALGREAELAATVGTTRLAAALRTAKDAMAQLFDLAAERERRHRDLAERIREANAKAPGMIRDRTRILDLAPGHGYALGFAVQTPDGARHEFRHLFAAHVVIAAAAAALEARTTTGEHNAVQLHTDMVLDAAATFAELPELAPSPDWRRTW